jgi:predicted PurR-regulated permease PerM
MNVRGILFATIIISFVLFLFSLYLSFKGINNTSKMIDFIENNQLKLARYTLKLEQEVKSNQVYLLQNILLRDIDSLRGINLWFKKLNEIVDEIKEIQIDDTTNKIINTIRRRIVALKIVEDSLINALKGKNNEDIEDAIIGFNTT